jgi:hypothetical protein
VTAHDTDTIPRGGVPLAAGDDAGIGAIRVMLADVPFPATKESLMGLVGQWRVPVPGDAALRLGRLMENVPDRTYDSPEALASAIEKAHPDLNFETKRW